MAEEDLNVSDSNTLTHKIDRVRVSEAMSVDSFVDSSAAGYLR